MKNNYKAWFVDENDYPKNGKIEDKIYFFLNYAILAPSTFNSQPWKCEVKNNSLILYLDTSRMLKFSDKEKRFLFISAGCFIENFVIAADHFGWSTKLNINVSDDWDRSYIKTATLTLDNLKSSKYNDEFDEIKIRATNRSIHLDKEVPTNIIEMIKSLVHKPFEIIIMNNEIPVESLQTIVTNADLDVWGDNDKRVEHAQWVRNNITNAYDGMPAFGVGIGFLQSLIAKKVMLSSKFPILQAKKSSFIIGHTKNFATLLSKDSEEDWINIGRIYERIALILSGEGIAMHPIGTLIESKAAREQITKYLELDKNLKPQVYFRFGYPLKKVKHSPRRLVKEIILNC